ncbi:MAG: M1 family peptidase [Magnetovibrio sp.]|nr:M1 family peptidase [Magnetovibrio sp.]
MRIWGGLFTLVTVLMISGPVWATGTADHTADHTAKVHIDPAKSTLTVHDVIAFDGGGEMQFSLSPDFTIDSAKLDGRAIDVQRDVETMTVKVGRQGRHQLELSYRSIGTSMLGLEGGFVGANWLAQPLDTLATWSIEGRIPMGQSFVMPGRLIDETPTDDHYVAHFENRTPSAPPVLITGPFEISEKMHGQVRIRTYFHKELAPLAQTYLEDTARYIGYYTGKVGPYPYPGFSIVSGPAPVGWGLPGMTYMGRKVLALPFIRYTSLPHEVLHNWWGNAVEVDYAGGNWAEGLTTYQADHAMAAAAKTGGGGEKRLEWLRNYAALPKERDLALTGFRSKTHDASQVVGYGKTAFVFHMLKTQLGAKVFDKALQRFNRDNTSKVAGWPKIQAAFEAESGQKLGSFFSAWIDRPGAPELNIIEAKTNDTRVTLVLEQKQTGAPYPLSLAIDIKTEPGTERHTAHMRTKWQSFTFTTKAKATALHVDPDTDVFRRLSSGEAPPILRDVSLDPKTHLQAFGSLAMRSQARELATSLLQARLRLLALDDAKTLIIAGPREMVRAHLARADLPPAPEKIAQRGDARAWTARTKAGQTILVVEAQSLAGMAGLTRVLPHYKRRSYVIMENGKTVDKGTWAPQSTALKIKF